MRFFSVCFLIFSLFFGALNLSSDPLHCTTNDTITSKDSDPHQLFKFLTGTWAIQGTWQVTEGQGKVKYTARASFKGTEIFKLILNGHFLERTSTSRLSYYSRDYGKKMNNNYSAVSIYSYNQNIDRFLMWSFDCSGTHLNARGYYNDEDQAYQFTSMLISENGDQIETLHSITYVNDDEFRWEVKQKSDDDYEWVSAARGTGTRQKKH